MRKLEWLSEKQTDFVKKRFAIPDNIDFDIQGLLYSYQQILENFDSPVLVLDKSGKIVFTSKSLKKYIWAEIEDVLALSNITFAKALKKQRINNHQWEDIWIMYQIDEKYKERYINEKLSEISKEIISQNFDINKISDKILETLRELTESEAWFVWYIEDNTLIIRSITASNWHECQINRQENNYIEFRNPEWLIWWWIQNQTSFFTNLGENDPRAIWAPEWHITIENFLTACSKDNLNNNIIWQISLANSPYQFSDEDLEIIQKFADILWVAIEKHKKEQALKKQIEFQKKLFEIAQSFMQIQSKEQFNTQAKKALSKFRRFFWMDQWIIYEFDDEDNQIINILEDPDTNNSSSNFLSEETVHKLYSQVSLWDSFYIFDTSTLDESKIKKELENKWIKSLVAIPIKENKKIKWFLVFNSLQDNKNWKQEDSVLLDLVRQILSDMYGKHLLEEELLQSKKRAEDANYAKSVFLANMSHEIRTPLNWIFGLIDALFDQNLSEEQQKIFYEKLQESKNRLLWVINDVLDISKIESNEIELEEQETNIDSLISDVTTLQKHAIKQDKNISINYKTDQQLQKQIFWTDAQKIYQILNNLVNNAVKFTKQWEINIVANTIQENSEYTSIQIDVSDTWPWISQNDIEKIFDKFTQTKWEYIRNHWWTWLGLNISKKLTEFLGGTIQVESKEWEWTCFSVFLEIPKLRHLQNQQEENSTTQDNTEKSVEYYNNFKILVAEDDEINKMILENILKKRGYQVVSVSNWKEAIKAFEKEKFDSIIMDVQMPEVSWTQATKEIRNISTDIPIIALSAHASNEDIQNIQSFWFDEYITKPVETKTLYQCIDKYLENSA